MAGSVGWNPSQDGNELLEFSMVPVPMDPDALPVRQARAYQRLAEDLLALTGEDLAEDEGEPEEKSQEAPTEESRAARAPQSLSELAHALKPYLLDFLRRESEPAPDPQPDIWTEAARRMARVFLTPELEDAERKAEYAAAAKTYRQVGKVAPEYLPDAERAALSLVELRGLFLEGEPELLPDLFAEQRAGAVLSGRNKNDLEEAMRLIRGVLDRAAPMMDEDEMDEEMDSDAKKKSARAAEPEGEVPEVPAAGANEDETEEEIDPAVLVRLHQMFMNTENTHE
jgi:hypothetical protein